MFSEDFKDDFEDLIKILLESTRVSKRYVDCAANVSGALTLAPMQ